MSTMRVGILLYDGCFASEAFGIVDVLTLANRISQLSGIPAPFSTSVHAARSGTVKVSGGTELHAGRIAYGLDLLVVPGFDLDPGQDLQQLLIGRRNETALIERVHARGIPIASICVGAFLLGEAGLIDGRNATTAWLLAKEFGRRYPKAMVDPSALIVEDGPITTTGAFSAAHDLALHLVRLHAGADVARQTAKVALTTPGRTSQAPYIDETLRESSTRAFSARVRRHLLADLAQTYDLASLSAAHHVSTRTMLRRFRAETGQTPLSFLQTARISRAKALLEATTLNVAEIAREVSYGDPSTFRRLFTQTVGITPSDYRRSFA